MVQPFILFDDVRSAEARLYADPEQTLVATKLDEVLPVLERVREALAAGRHVAGYLAYEAGDAFEAALQDGHRQAPGPLAWFGIFDSFESVDVSCWLPEEQAPVSVSAPHPRVRREDYLRSVVQVRDLLYAGEFYQANLTFCCDVEVQGDPLSIYRCLRERGGGSWGGVVRHEGRWLLSFSPEQFFTLRNGLLEARPMKGTASLDEPPEALRNDPKQRAENLMIVDLLRNDLARVSDTGSVQVPDLFVVEDYPTLRQMVSRVTARLRQGLDVVDVLQALFPCGSITGAPKISAIRHLRSLEPEPRGIYTGSMGWMEPSGDASFNVMIRTLELSDGRSVGRLGLGSGLVADSVPEDEWRECLAKGAFLTRQSSLTAGREAALQE